MSISIGKTPRYEVSDIALTIYTNASNLLKLNSEQQQNNLQFRDFKFGQLNIDPKSFELYHSNILLTHWNSNQLQFLQNAQYQSNITISKNLIVQNNVQSINFNSSNLQIQYLSDSPLRIYDSSQNIFLELNSVGDLKYMGNIGIGLTNPHYALDVIDSAFIYNNLYNKNLNSSNLLVNEIRALSNIQNRILFGINTIQLNSSEVIIENPTLSGTITYEGQITLQQSTIGILESCNIRIINKSLNNHGVLVHQLNPSFGLTSNHNAIHIDSYFSSINRTLPIFVLDTFGRISSGKYTSNLPNPDAAFGYKLDDTRAVYLSGFMNLSTCNDLEKTIIDKKGHLGIGTSSTQHFLQITNPYTSYESYYQKPSSLIGLYQMTSNTKPYMILYNCNEAICFQINSNGDLLFQSQKLYDERYRFEVTSNAYIQYVHTDQLYSSTGIVNFTQSQLCNIDQLTVGKMYVMNSGTLSNIYANSLTINDINIGAFDYINVPSTNYEEFRIATTRFLYIGSNFVMNPNPYFFEIEQSNLPNDKIRIYANGDPTKDVNVIHTIANNRVSTLNITNCNTTLNSIAQIQLDANRNIYQFGIVNTSDFYGEGYITCNLDITNTNRELTFTNDGTRIGNKIHLLKSGKTTLNDSTIGTHNLTISGDLEVISETNGTSNFIITSQGNIGFGTNQPRTFVDINTSNIFILGNLGIGTLTPSYPMDINGTLNASRILGISYEDLQGDQGNQWTVVSSGIYYRDLSCNVGIGTTLPNASLHIHTSNQTTPSFGCYTTDKYPILEYNPFYSQLKISGGLIVGYNSTSNQYHAPKDSLIVDGSIGIGTTIPTQSLHVQGDVRITGNTSNEGRLYIGTNASGNIGGGIYFGGTSNDNSYEHTVIENRVYSTGTQKSELLIFKGRDVSGSNTVPELEFSSVVWSASRSEFVAVIYSFANSYHTNTCAISLDGVHWTINSSPSFNYNSITWSPELSLYVAVGEGDLFGSGDLINTSPDAITWTTRTYPEYNEWHYVCWSPQLSIFVAVGYSGISSQGIMTSSDGITWTTQTKATSDSTWSSICWAPELSLFVAVASAGTANRVMTSTNGTIWTARSAAANNNWTSICWSPQLSLFVAVAKSGTGNRVMTSSNGINWSTQTSPADNEWVSVCWAAELSLFVAVSQTGSGNRVMTSSNGITWTIGTLGDNTWRTIYWAPELYTFVAMASAVSGSYTQIVTSPNGMDWYNITGIYGPDRIRLRAGQVNFDVYSSTTTDRNTENTQGYVTSSGITMTSISASNIQTNSISDANGIYLLQRNIYDTPGEFTITTPSFAYRYARIQMWGAGGGGGGADLQGVVSNGAGSVIPGGGGGGGGAYGEIILPKTLFSASTLVANIGYGGQGGLGGYIATSTAINVTKISSTAGVGQAGTDGANGTATTLALSITQDLYNDTVSGSFTLTANWYANGGTGGKVGIGTTVTGAAGTGGTVLGTFNASQSGVAGGAGGLNSAGANGTNLAASGFAASGGGGGGGLPATLPAPKLNYSGGNSGTGCIPKAYLSGTAAKAFGELVNGTGTIQTASQSGYTIYNTYGGGTGGGGSSSLASTIAGGLAIVNRAKDGGWPGGGGGGGGSAKQVFANTGYSGYGASVTAGYGGNGGNGAIIITYY